MVIITGPRAKMELESETKDLKIYRDVKIKGYVPNLSDYFAVCDLAIVQGGGTTTLELTALKRPFIYFPVEGHFEQEKIVARRLARHQAGQKMYFSQTTPANLADAVTQLLQESDKVVARYAEVDTEGASRTAELIKRLAEAREVN